MTISNLSSSVRNSIFRILGTAQFGLVVRNDQVNFYGNKLCERGTSIHTFYNVFSKEDLLEEVYRIKDVLKERLVEYKEGYNTGWEMPDEIVAKYK
jgi:hypothetical protein